MIQKQSQKPELTKEQKEAQKKVINEMPTSRTLGLLVLKHKFILMVILWIFTVGAWAYQSLPGAAEALGQ